MSRDLPIARVPDLADASLRGSWLNKAVPNSGDDYSANGNDATTITPNAKWTKNGIWFPGTDDGLETFGADVKLFDAYPFAMSCWFKCDDDSVRGIILSVVNSTRGDTMYDISVLDDEVYLRVQNTTVYNLITTGSAAPEGQWNHVVGLFAGVQERYIYVNGELEGTDITNSANYSGNVDRWSVGRIGDSSPSNYFAGEIRDARFRGRALTADEIKYEYRLGVPQ